MSTPLFENLPEVRDRITGASHVLVCLDFGGTLTPLIDDPEDVTLPLPMRRTLSTLAASRRATLAVLSGRERTDLQSRVGIPGLTYAGNNGLEISGPGFLFIEPSAVERSELVEQFAHDLQKKLESIPGVRVEDKGLTIAIHYRQVSDDQVEEVRRIVHAALAGSSHPFLLSNGNKAYEIRPRVYWNRMNAVQWIKEGVQKPGTRIVYLGDGTMDEDAFALLTGEITISVGHPTETAARYFVKDLQEVRAFLDWLAQLLGESDPAWQTSGDCEAPMLYAEPA
jgi:trehalose 6-phosphate phosphatase